MIKSFFDVMISLLLIVLLSPIIIIIAIMIKATSKGPVIFKQKRVGAGNKEFTLLKFRTMTCDAPNIATELLKDAACYITPFGKLLRKSSLDELPQLFNILFGQMTFIGPRPALYNQYELIAQRTKLDIHKLVPGVTGWAQINGRDVIAEEEKVELDWQYLENKSLWFDLEILYYTVFKVLRAENILEGGIKNVNLDSEKNNTLFWR